MNSSELVVILPDIRSVYNVASIFRTADAAGVSKIICCGYTPTPHDRFGRVREDFKKVSLGAESSVSWEYAKDTAQTIKKLKTDGYTILAVEQAKNSISYDEVPQSILRGGKLAIVMGNEVDGLDSALLELTDHVVEIPMRGMKESLNVSVAFGIVVFSLGHSK